MRVKQGEENGTAYCQDILVSWNEPAVGFSNPKADVTQEFVAEHVFIALLDRAALGLPLVIVSYVSQARLKCLPCTVSIAQAFFNVCHLKIHAVNVRAVMLKEVSLMK